MGTFDTVEVGGRTGQVKCWERQQKRLTVGDWVGPVCGYHTYNIVMREGGYVQVFDGRISGWDRIPMRSENAPTFDKYGESFNMEVMKDINPYYFDSPVAR